MNEVVISVWWPEFQKFHMSLFVMNIGVVCSCGTPKALQPCNTAYAFALAPTECGGAKLLLRTCVQNPEVGVAQWNAVAPLFGT